MGRAGTSPCTWRSILPREIREAAREEEEINHEVTVILHYRFMIGNSGEGQKELGFQEVTTTSFGVP